MSLSADPRMVDYLLGRLTRADVDSIRQEIFEDEDAWNRVEAAEEELIDGYARGELDAQLRSLVEERILSSEEGRRKLRTALALAKLGGSSRRSFKALIGLAAAVLFALIGFALVQRGGRTGTAATPMLATLQIPLTTLRGDISTPQINLPAGEGLVRLEFQLPGAETDTAGIVKLIFRGGERSYPASIKDKIATLDVHRGALHPGPCDIELTTSGRLVAAGTVVFVD